MCLTVYTHKTLKARRMMKRKGGEITVYKEMGVTEKCLHSHIGEFKWKPGWNEARGLLPEASLWNPKVLWNFCYRDRLEAGVFHVVLRPEHLQGKPMTVDRWGSRAFVPLIGHLEDFVAAGRGASSFDLAFRRLFLAPYAYEHLLKECKRIREQREAIYTPLGLTR